MLSIKVSLSLNHLKTRGTAARKNLLRAMCKGAASMRRLHKLEWSIGVANIIVRFVALMASASVKKQKGDGCADYKQTKLIALPTRSKNTVARETIQHIYS